MGQAHCAKPNNGTSTLCKT